MTNYPDGMTKEDWRHIDGDEHHDSCPAHEEQDVIGFCICAEIDQTLKDDAEEDDGRHRRKPLYRP